MRYQAETELLAAFDNLKIKYLQSDQLLWPLLLALYLFLYHIIPNSKPKPSGVAEQTETTAVPAHGFVWSMENWTELLLTSWTVLTLERS